MTSSRRVQGGPLVVGVLVGLVAVIAPNLWAADFSLTFGLKMASGKYIYPTATNAYAITPGVRLHSDEYSFALSVPVLFQNSDLISRPGGMLLPNNDGGPGGTQGPGSHHGAGMPGTGTTSSSSSSSLRAGIGDMYLSGNYRLIEESSVRPSLGLEAQVKVPTAASVPSFGTGEWDYGGGIGLHKLIGSTALFVDAGYLVIGDPDSVTYRDPFTFGVGVGRMFGGGRFSTMLYFQAYTRVLEDYDAPRQLSATVSYQPSPSAMLSVLGSLGLSNTTPDLGIAMALEFVI